MTEHRVKVFKSGNSTAIRLPKHLGFKDGEDVVVVPHDDGSFSFWKERDNKAAFMSLSGSMSPGFMADGRDDAGDVSRQWDDAAASEAA